MRDPKKRRILKWLWVASAVILASTIAATLAIAVSAKQFRDSDQIAPNACIEGVPVGDMTAHQAKQAVRNQWALTLPQQIELRWDARTTRVPPEVLGARLQIEQAVTEAMRLAREGSTISQVLAHLKLSRVGANVPVATTIDRPTLDAYLVDLAPTVNRQPRNADISVVGDQVVIVPGQVGVQLDIPATAAALATTLTNPSLQAVDLVVETTPPAIRTEDLKHLQVVLATFSTRFKPWKKNRTHNLRLAIGNLSRGVIAPGETLSFNDRVGPRLVERGFRSADIFLEGEVRPSTGGGICQVASTLYNAALLAGLKVRERHHHSRPVTYVASGRDATVYWGQYDLKIHNNLTHPILILGGIDDNTMTIQILGSRADKCEVEIIRSGVAYIPFETKEVEDPELEIEKTEIEKKGRNGARVTVTRVIKRAGEVISRERLHADRYSPQTEVIRIGTKPPEDADLLEMGLIDPVDASVVTDQDPAPTEPTTPPASPQPESNTPNATTRP